MATFISKNRAFKHSFDKQRIDFSPLGSYTTEDEKIIEVLRRHPYYNKGFVETNAIPEPKGNTTQGIRTAATQGIIGKDEKLLRLGELRARLLKNDGSFRKDASDELIDELKELQGELGV